MNNKLVWGLIIVTLTVGAAYYIWQQQEEPSIAVVDSDNKAYTDDNSVKSSSKKPELATVNTITETVPEQPINKVPQSAHKYEEPLPELDSSDNAIKAVITKLIDNAAKLFLFKSFIRHFVVTIDNMPNAKLAQRYAFTSKVPGKFAVIKQAEDSILLDEKNYQRYKEFVALAERIDTHKIIAIYIRFYSLFQQAYEELGYANRQFHDRFVQVIEILLATPDVKDPILLEQPKVFYKFADPALESLPSGQKILLRIGYDNSQRVQSKLQELHRALIQLSL